MLTQTSTIKTTTNYTCLKKYKKTSEYTLITDLLRNMFWLQISINRTLRKKLTHSCRKITTTPTGKLKSLLHT